MVTAGNVCAEYGKIKHLLNQQKQSHAQSLSSCVCVCETRRQRTGAAWVSYVSGRSPVCVHLRECVCVRACVFAERRRAEVAEAADRLTLSAS